MSRARFVRTSRCKPLALACLCLGVAISGNALATLAPLVGDAHVNSASPNGKYGGAVDLQVSSTESALFKFNLTTLPNGTAGMDVEKATVIMWINKVAASGSVTLHPLTSPWDESSVTYNTGPGNGAQIAPPVSLAAQNSAQYLVFDVTAQVRAWLDTPGSNYGLVLRTSTTGTFNVLLDSKENVGIPAMLDITLLNEGAAGPQGPQGPAGVQGAAGAVGAAGPTGPIGPAGQIGPVGPTGATGAVGATGSPGAQGAAGAQGPVGAQGPAGPIGAMGAAGADGKTIMNGTAPPASTDGVDGDFYINTSTNELYGPKATGAWPASGVPLVGAAGATGPAGAQGATGLQGPQGLPGPAGATGAAGASGAQGAAGSQGPTGATGPQGPAGAQGATGAQGPAGPSSSYSVAVDINNNPVPFGWSELMSSFTLTNSEGIVARAASFTNTLFLKPGEQVNRQVLFITGGGQIYFPTAGCTGDVGYVSGSSITYSVGNGVATVDAAAAVNTPITFSFWRHDMTTPPTLNLQPGSMRSANGSSQNNPPALTSALKMNRGTSLTFLNAMWPVSP